MDNHFAGEDAGVSQDLLDTLRDRSRLSEGRRAAPSASLIDSAPVTTADTVGADSRGFDAGTTINAPKRHIAVDTVGLLTCVLVTGADVHNRTAAQNLLARLRYLCPSVRHLWADSGNTGTLIDWAKALFGISIEIVATLAGQVGCVVLHRRWLVERSLAWINQHRRCVRDYERLPQHHGTMVRWASSTPPANASPEFRNRLPGHGGEFQLRRACRIRWPVDDAAPSTSQMGRLEHLQRRGKDHHARPE